jgi:hypothetical protein
MSKDHFVPCGYLRHFVTEDSKVKNPNAYRKWRVHAYKKIQREEIKNPVRIDSVAYSEHFEHYKDNEGFNSETRERINQIETRFFPVQSKIIDTQTLKTLQAQDFQALVEFVALQRERTLARRNLYKNKFNASLDIDAGGEIKFSKLREQIIK